jgi:hypothetical protein
MKNGHSVLKRRESVVTRGSSDSPTVNSAAVTSTPATVNPTLTAIDDRTGPCDARPESASFSSA